MILCEDAWHAAPAKQAHATGAQVLLVPNASPYHLKKEALRIDVLRGHIAQTKMPLVYVNAVGGQDELVFDGGSFALSAAGEVVMAMPQFEVGLGIVSVSASGQLEKGLMSPPQSVEAQAYQALVLGVRDYVTKNHFPGVIIGLSGGVDSALVLAIAVDALGADKVRAVMMASRYTADISWIDASEMAKNSIAQIIAAGFDSESVEKVTRLIKLNEYKRRQAPPGVRVTTRAFGRDWRYPITSQFRA